MQNTVQPMYSDVERRLQEGSEDLVKGVGNLNMDHVCFSIWHCLKLLHIPNTTFQTYCLLVHI